MPPFVCDCRRRFGNESALTQHQGKCPVILRQSRESFRDAQRAAAVGEKHEGANGQRDRKRRRYHDTDSGSIAGLDIPTPQPEDAHPDPAEVSSSPEVLSGPSELQPPPMTTRGGRSVRPTWKVRDQVPEGDGVAIDAEDHSDRGTLDPAPAPRVRRLTLLVTQRIRTAANRFGISRLYKRRPVQDPEPTIDLNNVYTPTQGQHVPSPSKRTIQEIIAPHPNFTTFLFNHQFWLAGHKKTRNERAAMRDVMVRDDFIAADMKGVDFNDLDKDLGSSTLEAPWVRESDGWKKTSVTIHIPPLKKPNQFARREAAADQQRILRGEGLPAPPADHSGEGVPLTIPEFWHKDLCAEIRNTFELDDAAKTFVFDPYLMYHVPPGGDDTPEPVYSELFNSQAVVDEDIRIQHLPREPGDDLPRAIALMMWHSDVTHVTQFGDSKVWPGYLYFGNQTKYETSRPTCHAAHHVALFPSLPKDIQDDIKTKLGKHASAPVLAHLRRELFHAAWHILISADFIKAYREGIVVDCKDGIRRRIYPRIFTYSADYPEKMLIAALRDKGQHPCPHCLITFEDIPQMGTATDRSIREELQRVDSHLHHDLVKEARRLMYEEGYAVNGDKVNDVLKHVSGVPTTNTFSKLLGAFGLDAFRMLVPDILHEFELGLWKAVFSHLIRMLYSLDEGLVRELDRRYRLVSTFGKSTIRRFASNASEMHQIGARDFEDLLQCAIPCFEGLLPSLDNDRVLALLYVLAYWHGLAKMRMHIESSVKLLDATYTVLGSHLRHFTEVICPRYTTKETQKEYAKRARTASRKVSTSTTAASSIATGQKACTFNMSTIKIHLLGYAPYYIKLYGPLDMLSTMKGELEHRRVKARRARTNGRRAEAQMAEIEVREVRLRRMAEELRSCGKDVPDFNGKGKDTSMPSIAGPLPHHWIAMDTHSNITWNLSQWHYQHPDDPAVERFTHRLRLHLHQRLSTASEDVEDVPILIKDNSIYRHATFHVNYTTYDIRRDFDVIHLPPHNDNSLGFSLDKTSILVHNTNSTTPHPWSYAIVLGVFHAQVLQGSTSTRVEFLWVRWLDCDQSWTAGPSTRHLERLTLAPLGEFEGTDFIDPATVIRSCHLIPAFHYGLAELSGPPSVASQRSGDWRYYYVARFVDRDMVARYTGMSIGSGPLQAHTRENIEDDPVILHELAMARGSREAVSSSLPPLNNQDFGSDGEPGEDSESDSGQTDNGSIFHPDDNPDG